MHDLRLAVRALRATPIVTAVAALSLALGIGANTAIFSLVNSLLLRPLPVAQPRRLVTISSDRLIGLGFKAGAGWSFAMWDRLRQRAQIFDGAFAWSIQRLNLAQGGEMQPAGGLLATGDFFTTLGVPALVGRMFTSADDRRGGGPDGPVAVISYGFWQRRFSGDANVIGAPLVVEGVPFTIIGVTPPEFFGLEVGRAFDVALPLATEPLFRGARASIDQERSLVLIIALRLKAGQSIEAATAALRAMQPEILGPARMPDFLRDPFTLVPAAAGTSGTEPGVSGLRQRYERSLLTMLVVVAIVLFIASMNIANLLLARAAARRHELSVRLALGAPRWRLARQLLAESLVLSAIGAVLGLVFAAWSSRALVAQLSTADSRVVLNQSFDWRVLAFTAAVTIVTAVLFGTAPAFRAARVAPIEALKEHGRGAPGDGRGRLSGGLVVAQVALSLVLAVAAGLFVQTFARLVGLPLGFDADRVLVVTVDAARARIDPATRLSFYQRLVDAAGAVPGVAHAAGSVWTPVGGGFARINADVPGAPTLSEADRAALANFVTPGWFAAYGTPLRAGRDIAEGDSAAASPVVVVNEAFARRFFPGRSAIGGTVRTGERDAPARTIIGIVGDAVSGSLRIGADRSSALREQVPPAIYLPLAQSGQWRVPGATSVHISIRSAGGSPVLLARSVGAALTAVDSGLAYSVRPLADDVNALLQQERLVAMLGGFFGALAVLLAGLGLYGVTAYAVSRRRTEIGIRMALGAAPLSVVRLVLSRVLLLVGTGVVIGTGASLWAARFVAPLLYGLQPGDPITFSVAALALATVGALAGGLPAFRASRIDPADVLRSH